MSCRRLPARAQHDATPTMAPGGHANSDSRHNHTLPPILDSDKDVIFAFLLQEIDDFFLNIGHFMAAFSLCILPSDTLMSPRLYLRNSWMIENCQCLLHFFYSCSVTNSFRGIFTDISYRYMRSGGPHDDGEKDYVRLRSWFSVALTYIKM